MEPNLDDPWSRKLATASWSPSCVSKVLGGSNLQSHETSYVTTGNKIWQHLHPQHRCVFMPSSLPSSLSSLTSGILWASSLDPETQIWLQKCRLAAPGRLRFLQRHLARHAGTCAIDHGVADFHLGTSLFSLNWHIYFFILVPNQIHPIV